MQNRRDIKVIGVTGGTGSGKSSAARVMSEFGGVILDADKIAKELMKPGFEAYNAVKEYFGPDIIAPDGEIDRKALGEIVFNDKQKLRKLNTLTHTIIGNEIKKRVDELRGEMLSTPLEEGELRFIVLDVPIPVEEGFFDTSNSIWTVTANDDIRIERIINRSGISQEEAERMISAQMSNREYEEIADVVIINEKGLEELRSTVAKELINYFNISTDGYGEE